MPLELKTLTFEAAFFDGSEETAQELCDWIIKNNGRARVGAHAKTPYVDILSAKGSWFFVNRPGWVVRDPKGDHKLYTIREFRVAFGIGRE